MSIFEKDLEEAAQCLAKEKKRGFWKKFFTLGIIDNDTNIRIAQHEVSQCQRDLNRCNSLKSEASNLDQQDESIVIHGIRVSRYTFSDIRVLGHEDYPLEWESLRQLILQRDHFSCQEVDGCCSGPLQIHHIIELSRGGSNNASNLVTLCKHHHTMKHPHMQKGY